MNTKILLLLITISYCSMFSIHANNVQVTNISQTNVDADNHRIEFELTWENSWRKDSEEPYNYDGVWIFVKYRDCLEKASGNPGDYKHCWLSTTESDHNLTNTSVGGISMGLELDVGLTNIDGTDRGMGIFLYQPAGTRVGTVSADVSLLWKSGDHSPAENTAINSYDIQVFAIEMVYMPTDSFYLGDGVSYYCLRNGNDNNKPMHINSNSMNLRCGGGLNAILYTDGTSGNGDIDNNWPNGFDAFWVMKYEISQEQYVGFLNTLSRSKQNNRIATAVTTATSTVANVYIMSNSNTRLYRNAIVCEPTIPTGNEPIEFKMDYNMNRTYNENGDGHNIACNYLSAFDLLAYLDWAGLRPITEFEFEKTCRGPHQKSFGYTYQKSWGNTDIAEVTGITNPGQPTEIATNSGNGICVYNSNTSVQGPLRCGFAATATSNKYTSGASYYGVYETMGNLYEGCMSMIYSYDRTENFEGRSGDGLLNLNANADQEGWPQGITGEDAATYYIYYRGGGWDYTNADYISISTRFNYSTTNARNNSYGGRGGRYVSK